MSEPRFRIVPFGPASRPPSVASRYNPDAMTPAELAARYGAAIGLGFLLGLERERSRPPDTATFAGARTFPLIALLGAAAFDLQLRLGVGAIVPLAFAAVAGLAGVSYFVTSRQGDAGATTEVTVLLAFLLGGLCMAGELLVAATLTVAVLLMLSAKSWTHRLAARIEPADVEAVLKFAIVSVIVLPLLPNRGYGPEPLDVLNPYKVWLMVVLISGLNFAAYVLVKLLGQEHGIGLTGLLGGLASSTAVTLSLSQRSRTEPALSATFTLGILAAWTVMFFRVLALVALIDLAVARELAAGIGLLGVLNLGICAWLYRTERGAHRAVVESGSNPFELGQAVGFGLLFGVVLFAAKAAEVYFGEAGLYVAGAVAGLTDVDPVVLSMAELSRSDAGLTVTAARAILIAVLSNTLVKAVMAAIAGAPELRRRFLPPAVALLAAGAAVAAFLM